MRDFIDTIVNVAYYGTAGILGLALAVLAVFLVLHLTRILMFHLDNGLRMFNSWLRKRLNDDEEDL